MAERLARNHRFIGRQAILDDQMRLYGYELLFRTGKDNAFHGDGEDATRQTIDSCLSMAACSSNKNLFVNCTRDALVNMTVKLLPRRSVVLEVLESVPADADVVKACRQLKKLGFRLALDDFTPDEERRRLVEFADYIKVDFQACKAEERLAIYEMGRKSKPVFLAEKVETPSEVEAAKAEGNSLFQGYYYSRPEIIGEAQISTSRAAYVQLLAALAEPELDMRKMERVILSEPSLCFRLLRLANSAATGYSTRISSIQEALHVVGEDTFRKLATVTLATQLSNPDADQDVEQAMERAYFCESLAPVLQESPAELYMLGMFSLMDRMLNVPMLQLIEMISVGSRMQDALLGSTEGLGKALVLCKYYENGGECQPSPCKVPTVPDGAAFYFGALLAAGNSLRELHR